MIIIVGRVLVSSHIFAHYDIYEWAHQSLRTSSEGYFQDKYYATDYILLRCIRT